MHSRRVLEWYQLWQWAAVYLQKKQQLCQRNNGADCCPNRRMSTRVGSFQRKSNELTKNPSTQLKTQLRFSFLTFSHSVTSFLWEMAKTGKMPGHTAWTKEEIWFPSPMKKRKVNARVLCGFSVLSHIKVDPAFLHHDLNQTGLL